MISRFSAIGVFVSPFTENQSGKTNVTVIGVGKLYDRTQMITIRFRSMNKLITDKECQNTLSRSIKFLYQPE